MTPLALDPVAEPLIAGAPQIQVPVRGLAEHGHAAVQAAPWLDQLAGVQVLAAGGALVAARVLVTAEVARAVDVPVRQEPLEGLGEALLLGLLQQVALGTQVEEELLCEVPVVRVAVVGGPREHVELDPHAPQRRADRVMPAVDVRFVGGSFLLRLERDGDAVLVRAADEDLLGHGEPDGLVRTGQGSAVAVRCESGPRSAPVRPVGPVGRTGPRPRPPWLASAAGS